MTCTKKPQWLFHLFTAIATAIAASYLSIDNGAISHDSLIAWSVAAIIGILLTKNIERPFKEFIKRTHGKNIESYGISILLICLLLNSILSSSPIGNPINTLCVCLIYTGIKNTNLYLIYSGGLHQKH